MPERDSHCWKTLRKLLQKGKRERESRRCKNRTPLLVGDGAMRCHRNEHLEVAGCWERERLRGEEHDTNRFVAKLRPTWCDLGLWGLLLARASILISVDILCAYYGKHHREFSRDPQRSLHRNVKVHVYTFASSSSEATRSVDNNNYTIIHIHTLIFQRVPRRCYCDRYGEVGRVKNEKITARDTWHYDACGTDYHRAETIASLFLINRKRFLYLNLFIEKRYFIYFSYFFYWTSYWRSCGDEFEFLPPREKARMPNWQCPLPCRSNLSTTPNVPRRACPIRNRRISLDRRALIDAHRHANPFASTGG